MSTERIKLFEADIDVDGIIKKSIELREQMVTLRQDQKLLKLTVGETNEEFIKNEARLKKVSSEYRINQQQVSNLTAENGKLLSVEQKLTLALDKEVVSINAATKNNAELKKIRNEVNVETVEGQKAIADINKKLDENTGIIKGNVSALEEQKIGIGNYKESIKEALDETNLFKGGISNLGDNISVFTQKSKEAGGTGAFLKNSLTQAATGFVSLTKAAVGFIFTPVGAILAVLVGAFALVKSAMDRSETATNKIKKAFSAFQGITNTLLKILQPLGEFLVDGIAKGFEIAELAIYTAIDTIAAGLELLGFDEQAKSFRNFNAEIQEGAANAKALAAAEEQLAISQRQSRKIQLEYQKDAEKLRQLRDNENLSIKERISANDQLGKVLQNQLNDELKIAQLALVVANLRVNEEGRTAAALDQQAEALTTIADIQERITGQQSEQIVNRVSLEKDAADKAKDIAEKAFQESIKRQELELQIFIAKQGDKARTLQEQLALAESVSKKEIEIQERKFKAAKISKEEFDLFIIQSELELAKIRTEIVNEQLEDELQIFKDQHQSKIEANQFLNDTLYQQEIERIEAIAEAEKQALADKLEVGILSAKDYNEALRDLDIENNAARIELDKQRQDAIKEKEAVDLANQRDIDAERMQYDLDLQLADLERKKQQEIESAEKTGADIALIETKYAQQRKEIEEIVQNSKLQLFSNAAGQIAGIIGEQSIVGKAAALTQVAIDTYASATAAYKAMAGIPVVGPALGVIASGAAIVSGLANAKKIASTSLPKAEHGMAIDIGGQRHSSGGTKFFGEDGTNFEAEKGEKMFILNRQASAALGPLLSDINMQYGGASLSSPASYLAAGGQVVRGSQNRTIKTEVIDYDKLANMLTDGVRRGSMEGTSKGTYSGIVDREDNIKIAAGANF